MEKKLFKVTRAIPPNDENQVWSHVVTFGSSFGLRRTLVDYSFFSIEMPLWEKGLKIRLCAIFTDEDFFPESQLKMYDEIYQQFLNQIVVITEVTKTHIEAKDEDEHVYLWNKKTLVVEKCPDEIFVGERLGLTDINNIFVPCIFNVDFKALINNEVELTEKIIRKMIETKKRKLTEEEKNKAKKRRKTKLNNDFIQIMEEQGTKEMAYELGIVKDGKIQ